MKQYLLISCLLLLFSSVTTQAQEPPPARVVTTPVSELELAPSRQHAGVVGFDRISAVSSEVSGRVMAQHAVEGALLNAGDPLVELNTDLILKDIDIKQKQRAQVSSDIEKLNRTLQRLERLLANNSASRQAYDDALYDHRTLEKKRETLDEEVKRLQLQLDKSTVRAPFDGVVLEKLKEIGEWVNPGVPVCRIASTRDVVVKVSISENLVRYQKRGSMVTVSIPAFDQELRGTILELVPEADLRSKSVILKIAIPYQPGLMQNLSAQVEIPTGKRQTLHMVPRDALVNFQGNDFVFAAKDGVAKLIPIHIEARTGTLLGVTSDAIRVGMPVVVDGNDRLRPDQSVQVIEK